MFAIGETTVTIGDTICAAHFRGELAATWKRIAAIMEEGESASPPDDVELQASSEQFRIDRDLITVEETERWLEERGLTLDDFNNFLVRQWIDQAVHGELVGHEVIEYTSAPSDLRDALRIDLLFSGEFDRLATRLGWRSAARASAQDRVSDEAIEIERACFYQRSGTNDASLPAWLAGLERDSLWFNQMLELEAVFRRDCDALLTLKARERMLQSLRLPLTQFELEFLELDSLDAAREAIQCVSEDGESMEDVATAACLPFQRVDVRYEDLPEDLQRRLLSAMAGEILQPISNGDGFKLCRLVQKIESDLADEGVRSRVDLRIVERHFSELAARFVRWILLPASTA